MGSARNVRLGAQLLRLARGLRPGARDDEHVAEAVAVERGAGRANGGLALGVREVLRLAVAALDEDARDAAL